MADALPLHGATPQSYRLPLVDRLHGWVTTVDHKRLGLMYIAYALIFLLVAGVQALVIRIQLAIPNNTFVTPEVYNRLFTMHGTTMVFLVECRSCLALRII